MTITHVYYDGGTKDGKTLVTDPFDGNIYQEKGYFDEEEFYEQTEERREIDGVTYTVFRYAGPRP